MSRHRRDDNLFLRNRAELAFTVTCLFLLVGLLQPALTCASSAYLVGPIPESFSLQYELKRGDIKIREYVAATSNNAVMPSRITLEQAPLHHDVDLPDLIAGRESQVNTRCQTSRVFPLYQGLENDDPVALSMTVCQGSADTGFDHWRLTKAIERGTLFVITLESGEIQGAGYPSADAIQFLATWMPILREFRVCADDENADICQKTGH